MAMTKCCVSGLCSLMLMRNMEETIKGGPESKFYFHFDAISF